MLESVDISYEGIQWGDAEGEHTLEPTVAELNAIISDDLTTGTAQQILSAAWKEAENHCGVTWWARRVGHVFRLLSGTTAKAFPHRPIPDSLTSVEVWRDTEWIAVDDYSYAPDGVIRGLVEGELYRIMATQGHSSRPVSVVLAVLRLAAFRATSSGSAYRDDESEGRLNPSGYVFSDAVRKSGAAEILLPYVESLI